MSVRIKSSIKTPNFNGFVDSRLLFEINTRVVDNIILKLVSAGTSPVRGYGRFPAYKGVAGQKLKEKLSDLRSAFEKQDLSAKQKKILNAETKAEKKAARRYIYPYSAQGDFPNKSVRPVNLFLSGQMLYYYRAFNKNLKQHIWIGIMDSAPTEVRKKAEGNNYGMNGIPQRRFVPATGETFKVSIVVALRDVFAEAVGRLLNRRGK